MEPFMSTETRSPLDGFFYTGFRLTALPLDERDVSKGKVLLIAFSTLIIIRA